MRVDANVSVRRSPDDPYGTRCEIKNLNSLRSLGRAIEFEAKRQIALLESGEGVEQQTRHWDEAAGKTVTLRSKEDAYDYRYFLEPDLVPLVPDAEWRREVAEGLGPMPAARRARLLELVGNGAEVTDATVNQVVTVVDLGLDGLVAAAVEAGVAPSLALARTANEAATDAQAAARLDVGSYVTLLSMEASGALTATQTKTVLADLLAAGGGDPTVLAAQHGFEAMTEDSLEAAVADAVAAHPDEWRRYCEGEDKLAGFFIGRVMKVTGNQADGKAVSAELRKRRG